MTYDRRTGKPIASAVSKIAPEVVSVYMSYICLYLCDYINTAANTVCFQIIFSFIKYILNTDESSKSGIF